jgi:hypothetical protein
VNDASQPSIHQEGSVIQDEVGSVRPGLPANILYAEPVHAIGVGLPLRRGETSRPCRALTADRGPKIARAHFSQLARPGVRLEQPTQVVETGSRVLKLCLNGPAGRLV